MMTYLEKLLFIWKVGGLSQEAIAKKMDVSFTTISRWIHGKRRPQYFNGDKIDQLYSECILNIMRLETQHKIRFV